MRTTTRWRRRGIVTAGDGEGAGAFPPQRVAVHGAGDAAVRGAELVGAATAGRGDGGGAGAVPGAERGAIRVRPRDGPAVAAGQRGAGGGAGLGGVGGVASAAGDDLSEGDRGDEHGDQGADS